MCAGFHGACPDRSRRASTESSLRSRRNCRCPRCTPDRPAHRRRGGRRIRHGGSGGHDPARQRRGLRRPGAAGGRTCTRGRRTSAGGRTCTRGRRTSAGGHPRSCGRRAAAGSRRTSGDDRHHDNPPRFHGRGDCRPGAGEIPCCTRTASPLPCRSTPLNGPVSRDCLSAFPDIPASPAKGCGIFYLVFRSKACRIKSCLSSFHHPDSKSIHFLIKSVSFLRNEVASRECTHILSLI